MEKLIELANEYEIEKEKSERKDVDVYVEFEWGYTDYNGLTRWDKTDQWEGDNLYGDTAVAYLISKKFGMVKWLVENDKIDRLKFYGENEYTPIGVNAKSDIDQVYSVEEQILMVLSISDTPIEDLISYLK